MDPVLTHGTRAAYLGQVLHTCDLCLKRDPKSKRKQCSKFKEDDSGEIFHLCFNCLHTALRLAQADLILYAGAYIEAIGA